MEETGNLNDEAKPIEPSFERELDTYIKHLDSLVGMVPLVMELISYKLIDSSENFDKFLKKKGKTGKKPDGKNSFSINIEDYNEFEDLSSSIEASRIAYKFLPINFIVSFVSQYDAYLGRLIRTMYLTHPEILNTTDKNFQLSDLLDFKSIDEAKDFIIEKEVESVLRDSHLKQFQWLEQKLKIPLRDDLPNFKLFIEITERRNLFVHCNGIVSRQYLKICRENNVPEIEKLILNERLGAPASYLNKCYSVLFEMGVKLGHVLWRKLLPLELEQADKHLNNVCYELMLKGKYGLATNLLKFATETLKKHSDQEMVLILTINKALSFKLRGKNKECKSTLDSVDWSAYNDKFKLALAVLCDNFEEAVKLMRVIGNNNNYVTITSYREWPLFFEFRKTEIFANTFKEIFNEDFLMIEKKPQGLTLLVNEVKTKLEQRRKEKEEVKEEELETKGNTLIEPTDISEPEFTATPPETD